jgi:hypothetical protein
MIEDAIFDERLNFFLCKVGDTPQLGDEHSSWFNEVSGDRDVLTTATT